MYENNYTSNASTITNWWPDVWKPRRPYATDRLADGIYREPRAQAIGRKYVEANPAAMSNLLVVDIDHSDSALRALSANGNHPMPNVVMETPRSGHAHAVWALSSPIVRTEYGHLKPLAYAAAVAEGLRRAVGGDRGYSGLMTKNPMHPDWHVMLIRTDARQLCELEAGLGDHMPERGWRQRLPQADIAGLGRNCAIFEMARKWAYRQVHRFFDDPEGLRASVVIHAEELNGQFGEPLPTREVRTIADSIYRWITRRSQMWAGGLEASNERFAAIQSSRGRRSGRARRDVAMEREAEAVALRESGLSYQEVGDRLGISRDAASGLIRRALHRSAASPPRVG